MQKSMDGLLEIEWKFQNAKLSSTRVTNRVFRNAEEFRSCVVS